MYECMSIYDDCNQALDEAEINQLATIGSEAEWRPKVKDEEHPHTRYTSQSRADQRDIRLMPSTEAITDEVCRGLGSSESEKLEVHIDIRNHGFEGLFDGVLGSELHLEPKHTCLHCNRTRKAKVKGQNRRATENRTFGSTACGSAALIKMKANRPNRRVTAYGGHPRGSEPCSTKKSYKRSIAEANDEISCTEPALPGAMARIRRYGGFWANWRVPSLLVYGDGSPGGLQLERGMM
ncbi:hypothetical protein BDD12DRAFT_881571 [Trichophaea hybrida]|nr:hypothetical protein BDD12DRAFT_881571 [Trichophaea hybrida]